MEYYYISFKDRDIVSYNDENTPQDKANKLIGNYFKSLTDAKNALSLILSRNND